jgi:hypothetical protein
VTNTALRLVNQDHQTIFEALRYSKIKRTEVANQILCIFVLSGASCVLQSDNVPQYSTELYKV